MTRDTVWILGDQLHRDHAGFVGASPDTHRILFVESAAKIRSKKWHIQRAHFIISSMRRFADELRAEGFEVDYRRAESLRTGLVDHRRDHAPSYVRVMEPASWSGLALVRELGCTIVRNSQFLCHYEDFAAFAAERSRTHKTLKMEDFYRWQRARLGYLMDADGRPVTGKWNYDHDNRLPPPKDAATAFAAPLVDELDDLDHEIIEELRPWCTGNEPTGLWATTRSGALRRLDHFVDEVLPSFGPHEDAMTTQSWHLAHSLLSPYLNIGLLHPAEVCDRVQRAHDEGRVPIASAEGFIRQVIGWREYVWGRYWSWMPDYRTRNDLGASMDLPPVFDDHSTTQMRCMSEVLGAVHSRAYAHHIQRLMIIGNLCLTAGIEPQQVNDWMWANFVDGAEWVMLPNVIGMSQFADGGMMATKPYASGGAYIHKMSDYCRGCRYDRSARVGDDACPFTTLYWDFMARHEQRFARNPRVAQQVRAAFKLSDLPQVRERAVEVRAKLAAGEL
jgi:deoxyribodipyrimidine photolyase-related protein